MDKARSGTPPPGDLDPPRSQQAPTGKNLLPTVSRDSPQPEAANSQSSSKTASGAGVRGSDSEETGGTEGAFPGQRLGKTPGGGSSPRERPELGSTS